MNQTKRISFSERAKLSKNALSSYLFNIMEQKNTNLALSADVTSTDKLIDLIEQCGPEICILKTHIDILEDFAFDITTQLKQMAQHYQFLILEDRKFADIGKTVQLQYQGGIYRIAEWADLVTVHSLPGPGCLTALQEVVLKQKQGVLLLAEMSSQGNLAGTEYRNATLNMAKKFPDLVTGFIAQHALSDDPGHIHLTPGVQFMNKQDNLGQQYQDPKQVITQQGGDIIIVGRGITAAANPAALSQEYRKIGWQAYQDVLHL